MLKVVYAGSPEASAETLEYILNESIENPAEKQFEIVGVLTNPPSAQGRHKELIPTPVAQTAQKWNEEHNGSIKIFTPEHLDSELRIQIAPLNADLFICFAYGHIFGPKFMALFPMGGLNLHPSLLPKYRGCTPVNAAILNDDDESGFSIQKMVLACDEGDIIVQKKNTLTKKETADELLNYYAAEGAKAFVKILMETAANSKLPESVPQSGEATYCPLIKKDDGKINWNDSAKKIDCQLRAYTPWPGCFTFFNGIQLKILKGYYIEEKEAAGLLKDYAALEPGKVSYDKSKGVLVKCGTGLFAATELQLQGKKAMDYKSFMNGVHDFTGSILN